RAAPSAGRTSTRSSNLAPTLAPKWPRPTPKNRTNRSDPIDLPHFPTLNGGASEWHALCLGRRHGRCSIRNEEGPLGRCAVWAAVAETVWRKAHAGEIQFDARDPSEGDAAE